MTTTFSFPDGLTVNRLGFGAMRITGEGIWGEPRDANGARRVLQRAVELGVDFIDTADSYGPQVSERLIGEALHPYPEGLIIATKGGLVRPGPGDWQPDGRPEHLRQALETSLRLLKLEQIDLYQLHRIDSKVPLETTLGEIKRFQAEGLVRHVGLSEVTVEQIEAARQILPIVSVQNRYNLADREWEGVLEYCEQENIAFIPWYPLAVGDLAKPGGKLDAIAQRHGASPSQVALAWLLGRSDVMLPIPGTSSVGHLEENMAAQDLRLSADEIAEIGAIA